MQIADSPQLMLFALILMRMFGFILLNPVLGKNDIPPLFRAALAFMLAVTVYPAAGAAPAVGLPVTYVVLLVKEFAVGFALAFVMQLFEMVVSYAGALLDFQMGLSMATVYDSQTGSQFALTGKILQTYFYLLFFAVGGHLTLIRIIAESAQIVPYGQVMVGPDAARAVLDIFAQCIVLAVKLALPVIVFEFLMSIASGLMMRIIPQINLFVINIQLRVIMGVVLLVFMISPIGSYLQNVINNMLDTSVQILKILA